MHRLLGFVDTRLLSLRTRGFALLGDLAGPSDTQLAGEHGREVLSIERKRLLNTIAIVELDIGKSFTNTSGAVTDHAHELDVLLDGLLVLASGVGIENPPETLLNIRRSTSLLLLAGLLVLFGGLAINERQVADKDAALVVNFCRVSKAINSQVTVQNNGAVQGGGGLAGSKEGGVDSVCVGAGGGLIKNLALRKGSTLGNTTTAGECNRAETDRLDLVRAGGFRKRRS